MLGRRRNQESIPIKKENINQLLPVQYEIYREFIFTDQQCHGTRKSGNSEISTEMLYIQAFSPYSHIIHM